MSDALASAAATLGSRPLAVVAKRAYVHRSHRTVTNDKAVLNRVFPRAQSRGRRRKGPLPGLSLKEVYLHSLRAAA